MSKDASDFKDAPSIHSAQPLDDCPDTPIEKAESNDDPEAASRLAREVDAACHPYTWPQSRKMLILLTGVSATFLIGLNATSEATAAEAINEQFGVSDASFPNSYWPVTAWNVGAAFAPLVVLPIMENFGVRYIYLVRFPFITASILTFVRFRCLSKGRPAIFYSSYS